MAGWKPLLEVTLLRDQLVNTGRAKAPAKAPPAFQPPTQAAHAPQTRESTDSKSTVALSSSSSSPSSSSSAASSLSVAVSASSSLRAGSRKSVVYSPKASYASSGTAGSSWKVSLQWWSGCIEEPALSFACMGARMNVWISMCTS